MILALSEREESRRQLCWRVCECGALIFESLYFSCDLLVVLLPFSLLPIYFYSEKRVGFRSITTK